MEIPERITWKDYMGLSIRTLPILINNIPNITINNGLKDGEETFNDLKKLLDRIHMVLGIISETREYEIAFEHYNRAEELADKCWYLSGYLYILNDYVVDYNFEFEFNADTHVKGTIIQWDILNDELKDLDHLFADLIKKEFAYKSEKVIDKDLIRRYLKLINDIANNHGIDMKEALSKNIAKLYVRFPNKFNREDAIYRNIENEKKVL